MANYTFSSLNDKDFEELVRDLLNKKLSLQLQSFKAGIDQGRDLRESTEANPNAIVVQVKHYAVSGYQLLIKSLKTEILKVRALQPSRYIIATSVSLSAKQKDEITELFQPYIVTANDVLGQNDFNSLLHEYPEVEQTHFKLWLSSIATIQNVIQNGVIGRSRYLLEKLTSTAHLYVRTQKYSDARQILSTEKILVVTGQPGVGKTSLAQALVLEYAKDGVSIYQVQDIVEAEDFLSPDNSTKQLFYFDDFLGTSYLEIAFYDKNESRLVSFIERLINTPNKYIILTTRTVIMNYAKLKFERVARSQISKNNIQLELVDYDKYEKALILYNHAYFTNNGAFLKPLVDGKLYLSVVNHINYTPRIIEFITDPTKADASDSKKYKQYVIESLKNPSEIWRHSFMNQINYFDRCLLLTMFTLENGFQNSDLELCFQERLDFERTKNNQIIRSNQFEESIHLLLNGFISSTIFWKNDTRFNFINPSLRDFIIGYLQNNYSEVRAIIESTIFAEQLSFFDPTKSFISLLPREENTILERIRSEKINFISYINNLELYIKRIYLIPTILSFCKKVNIDDLILSYIEYIPKDARWNSLLDPFLELLTGLDKCPRTRAYIGENFTPIIENLIPHISEVDELKLIPDIFNYYSQSFESYAKTEPGKALLLERIKISFDYELSGMIQGVKSEIDYIDEIEGHYRDLNAARTDFVRQMFGEDVSDPFPPYEYDVEEWIEQIADNRAEKDQRKKNLSNTSATSSSSNLNESQINILIDDLFLNT